MNNVKNTYDDEMKVLKKRIKELDDKIVLMKKMIIKKDGEIYMLQERIKGSEREQKIKMEHAELLLKLAGALEDGMKSEEGSTKTGGTKY